MNLHRVIAFLAAIYILASAQIFAQHKTDISSVVASGKVKGDVYENTYFGISLTASKAHFTAPSLVNVEGRRARLVNIVYDSP